MFTECSLNVHWFGFTDSWLEGGAVVLGVAAQRDSGPDKGSTLQAWRGKINNNNI
jgi:hypothetical protein